MVKPTRPEPFGFGVFGRQVPEMGRSITGPVEIPGSYVPSMPGPAVMRAAGERISQRLTGGSCIEMSLLRILVSRNPRQKLEDPRYTAEQVREAARNVAHCWMEVGGLSDSMKRFKGNADALRQKAELLMKAYGLSAEEVARPSGLPPEPVKG